MCPSFPYSQIGGFYHILTEWLRMEVWKICGFLCWIKRELGASFILDRSLRKVKNNGKHFTATAICRIAEPTANEIYDTHHGFREHTSKFPFLRKMVGAILEYKESLLCLYPGPLQSLRRSSSAIDYFGHFSYRICMLDCNN